VTLWLRQPTADETPPPPSSSREPRPRARATGCVLLVDDDDLVRETLVAQLEDLGFTTLAASNGLDALTLLDTHRNVDALVCDQAMPDLNGLQTIRAVNRHWPELPCFLLTGEMGEQTAPSHADSFTLLRKPLSGATLAAHIEAALAA
jgi:CheY-like chemotaxis protein